MFVGQKIARRDLPRASLNCSSLHARLCNGFVVQRHSFGVLSALPVSSNLHSFDKPTARQPRPRPSTTITAHRYYARQDPDTRGQQVSPRSSRATLLSGLHPQCPLETTEASAVKNRSQVSYLDEAYVPRLFPETLSADVEAVLADETGAVSADATVQDGESEQGVCQTPSDGRLGSVCAKAP